MLEETHGLMTESFDTRSEARILDPEMNNCHAPANDPTSSATTSELDTALYPDPGTESDFIIENNPFAFTPGQLSKLINPKSWPLFQTLGLDAWLNLNERDRVTINFDQLSDGRRRSSLVQRSVVYRKQMSMRRGLALEVNGTLNGRSVVAVPDTGSCLNLISEKKATSLGLQPIPGTHGPMSLPNGVKVMSPGQVQVTFSFDREEETHTLLCGILPRATRDFVLGSRFLKTTMTMTRYTHRIKRVFRSLTQPSLNLIGAEQDLLSGYINGSECLAVPDTGSDIMAMSLEHAYKLGLKVRSKERHRTLIEFLDGSRVLTDGIAHADWQFAPGEAPISCDFHVIKGLPVDAILSNTLLDEFDVFSRYEERIGSAESLESSMGIYGIALVEVCEQTIRSLSDSFLDDITSDNPFTREKVERERARRDEIRDAIAQIPDETLRAAKQDEEHMRKWRWDNLRKR